MAARLHFLEQCGHTQVAVVVLGRKNHSFTDESVLELAWSEVCHEEHLLAYQLLRLIPLTDAAHDSAVLQAVGNLKLKQFLHLRHTLALKHGSYTNVELLEVVEADCFLDMLCLIVCCLIGFNGIGQFLLLEGNHVIFNLAEQQ